MGTYVYKTSPTSTKTVTVEQPNGLGQVTIEIQLYEFAYKPYNSFDMDYEMDQKLHNRFIAPSNRAFAKRGTKPYPYGALATKGMPFVGDSVFETNQMIAFRDDPFFNGPNYIEIGKIVAIGKKKMVSEGVN